MNRNLHYGNGRYGLENQFAACTLRTIDDEQKLAGVRDPVKRVFADLEMRKHYVKGMEYVISDECAGCAANGAAREGLVEMFWTTGDWEEAARRKRELLDGRPRQFVRQGYGLNEQQELVLSAVGGPHSAALIALEKFCQCNLDGKQTAQLSDGLAKGLGIDLKSLLVGAFGAKVVDAAKRPADGQ